MPQRTAALLPRTYYSSRSPPPIPTDAPGQVQRAIDPVVGNGSVGGAGAAITWQGRQVGHNTNNHKTGFGKWKCHTGPASVREPTRECDDAAHIRPLQ
eukprot:1083542-Prorocentrum_minimum.AAC.2